MTEIPSRLNLIGWTSSRYLLVYYAAPGGPDVEVEDNAEWPVEHAASCTLDWLRQMAEEAEV